MPKPAQLSQQAASQTLLSRMAGGPGRVGLVDRMRQIGTKLGARPYEVDLVWVAWSAGQIGVGDPSELARFPLVPNPIVSDLTAISRNPFAAGILPVGAIKLTEISPGQCTEDLLRGRVLPNGAPGAGLPSQPVEFFYEVRLDGRMTGAVPQPRTRYRLLGEPFLDTCCLQFQLILERASEDPSRSGSGIPDRF